MESFDVAVIGAGSGLNISSAIAGMGLKVAVVEKGPMGGTCLNRGCIPSKMLIHSADVAETVANAAKFGIAARISRIDFKRIVARVSGIVDKDARELEQGIKASRNITLFKTEAKFVGKRKLKAGSSVITADKFFIMAGSRPAIPPVKGLKDVPYITSTEALRLQKLPKSLAIIGGGYIAAELAHFFGSLGSAVSIIEEADVMLPNEDSEVASAFTGAFRKKYNVLTGCTAEKVAKKGKNFVVTVSKNGSRKNIVSEQLLVATGRIPNSDILEVSNAGIKTDRHGYVVVDDYLETSAKGVWAGGDIIGKYMFKHSANLESQCMFRNAFSPSKKLKVDYRAMPHAVFSSPQVAGVGFAERDLKKGTYGVGRYRYIDTGMGAALQDNYGFVKILVEKKTNRILGCHIIGTDASTLIHEVVVAMKSGNGSLSNITGAVHVHPALPEVVQRAALSVKF